MDCGGVVCGEFCLARGAGTSTAEVGMKLESADFNFDTVTVQFRYDPKPVVRVVAQGLFKEIENGSRFWSACEKDARNAVKYVKKRKQ